jgi:hypothetical protein
MVNWWCLFDDQIRWLTIDHAWNTLSTGDGIPPKPHFYADDAYQALANREVAWAGSTPLQ